MKSICHRDHMVAYFGKLYKEAVLFMTESYPFLIIDNDEVFIQLHLETIFSEPMELFSVDPSLVSDIVTISTMCQDETLDPELNIAIQDWLEEVLHRDPMTSTGEIWFSITELKEMYGKEFDADMTRVFPLYSEFAEYLSE